MCSLIMDVDLGQLGGATHIAWCEASNLVAVAGAPSQGTVQVAVLDPQCPLDKALFVVPLAGSGDALAGLAWSPLGCRRMLLTATKAGALLCWTQDRSQHPGGAGSLLRPLTINEWWGSPVGHTDGGLAAACWLSAPLPWRWDAASMAAADFALESVQSLFRPEPENSRAGVLDWLRPGLPALALVSASGQVTLMWGTYGREGMLTWSRTLPHTLPNPDAAVHQQQQQQQQQQEDSKDTGLQEAASVVSADVACDGANNVLVAYAFAGQAGVHVARLAGDPVFAAAGTQTLPITCEASFELPAGSSVHMLRWDPTSRAEYLVSVAANVDNEVAGCTVRSHKLPQVGAESSQAAQAQCEGLPQAPVQWASDGSALAVVCSASTANAKSQSVQLLSVPLLQPLAPHSLPSAHSQAVTSCCAFSPSSACICTAAADAGAATGSSSGAISLRFWCLPQSMASSSRRLEDAASTSAGSAGDPAKLVAGRLAWAMLTRRHGWDAVQAALQWQGQEPSTSGSGAQADGPLANGTGGHQGSDGGAWQVLGWVDTLIHAHHEYSRPNFYMAWDKLKLGIALGLPCARGRLLAADLRLRLVLTLVLPVVCAAVTQALDGTKDTVGGSRVPLEDLQASAPWLSYFTRVLHYLLCCFKAWATARLAPGAAGDDAAHHDGLPGVHLMPDLYVVRPYQRLHDQLRAAGALLAKYQGQDSSAAVSAMDGTYQTFRILFDLLSPQNASADASEQQQFLATVERVQGVFGNLNRLHYCRLNPAFAVPASLEELQQQVPGWQALPLLSAAELYGQAQQLGLLHPVDPFAAGRLVQQLHLHRSFRCGIHERNYVHSTMDSVQHGSPDERTAKRRRWVSQQREALGGGALRCLQTDLIMGTPLFPEAEVDLESVDGSVVTSELTERVLNSAKQGSISQQLRRAWLCCSPLTGSAWKRLRTAAV